MTSDLRKAHKLIWILLVVLIPVLMYFSIAWDPYTETVASENTNTTDISSFIDVNKHISYETKDNKLFIYVKEPLKNASAAVYEVTNEKKGVLLGEVSEAEKLYIFNISKNIDGFELYDIIKNKLILKIKL